MIKIRLKELMEDKNLTPSSFAEIIGVKDKRIVYEWIKDEKLPSYINLIKIADYFNCSLDYLLGRSEYNEETKFKKPEQFDKQLKNIMKYKNISQYKLTKDKVAYAGYFNYWFVKKNLPTTETLIKLADYFNISVDELVGRV